MFNSHKINTLINRFHINIDNEDISRGRNLKKDYIIVCARPFIKKIPFTLTGDQNKAIDEILKDKITINNEKYAKFGNLPPNGIKGLCYFKVQEAEEQRRLEKEQKEQK